MQDETEDQTGFKKSDRYCSVLLYAAVDRW